MKLRREEWDRVAANYVTLKMLPVAVKIQAALDEQKPKRAAVEIDLSKLVQHAPAQ